MVDRCSLESPLVFENPFLAGWNFFRILEKSTKSGNAGRKHGVFWPFEIDCREVSLGYLQLINMHPDAAPIFPMAADLQKDLTFRKSLHIVPDKDV